MFFSFEKTKIIFPIFVAYRIYSLQSWIHSTLKTGVAQLLFPVCLGAPQPRSPAAPQPAQPRPAASSPHMRARDVRSKADSAALASAPFLSGARC